MRNSLPVLGRCRIFVPVLALYNQFVSHVILCTTLLLCPKKSYLLRQLLQGQWNKNQFVATTVFKLGKPEGREINRVKRLRAIVFCRLCSTVGVTAYEVFVIWRIASWQVEFVLLCCYRWMQVCTIYFSTLPHLSLRDSYWSAFISTTYAVSVKNVDPLQTCGHSTTVVLACMKDINAEAVALREYSQGSWRTDPYSDNHTRRKILYNRNKRQFNPNASAGVLGFVRYCSH